MTQKSQSNWLSSNSQIRPIFRVLWGSSQGLIRSCVGDQVRNLSTWHVFPIWAVGRGHGVEKCNNRLSSWISVKHRKFIILHKLHKWMMRPSSRIAWMMMEALQKNTKSGRREGTELLAICMELLVPWMATLVSYCQRLQEAWAAWAGWTLCHKLINLSFQDGLYYTVFIIPMILYGNIMYKRSIGDDLLLGLPHYLALNIHSLLIWPFFFFKGAGYMTQFVCTKQQRRVSIVFPQKNVDPFPDPQRTCIRWENLGNSEDHQAAWRISGQPWQEPMIVLLCRQEVVILLKRHWEPDLLLCSCFNMSYK